MKIGTLSDKSVERLQWLQQEGFGSFEWNRFHQSDIALASDSTWEPLVHKWEEEIQRSGLRLSAIGAIYTNALDPLQKDMVGNVMLRAISVAKLLGVKTVACFGGAVIEQQAHARRGAPVDKPFDQFIPEFCQYWKPIAKIAESEGIRIAFENCTQGVYYLPVWSCNLMAQPANWSKVFDGIDQSNVGLEWDPSHLICQGIDPIENLKEFGSRVFHMHAKDALVRPEIIHRYGRCHPEAACHRFPGYGQADWLGIIQTLKEVGYDSDLTIEGWHDPVMKGDREIEGLLYAKKHLEQWV